jgi:MYXO-CTERM domain-containing protein
MNIRMRSQSPRWIFPTAVAAVALSSTVAWAGDIKIGTAALEVDDKGNLTAAGRKGAVDTLDEEPGEDMWKAFVWAKLDNAAEGPLYFEFYQNLGSGDSLVWRYDAGSFPGGKYWSGEIELEGGRGFNKDRTYEIKAVQVSPKGKDLTLATGKVKLIKSGKKPDKPKDDEEGGDEDKVPEDQDAHDSLAGGEDDKGDGGGGGDEPPPPVEPKSKKGCSIDTDGAAFNGALLLALAGFAFTARRRRRA